MATLDSSIVNVALPSILADFQVSLALVEWVPNAYLLAITGLLLAFGRLADIHGQRRVFLAGLAVFTVGSGLCAASGTALQLIAARVVQGTGAAMVMACSAAIVTAVFPPEQRGRGLGLVGTTVALGLTSGPALGGLLLGLSGWRSLFLLNLPVGVLGMALTVRFLPPLRFGREHQAFDFLGAILLTLGCTALLLALNRGPEWGAAAALTVAAAGAAGLAAFALREAKVREPLLELRLFRNRGFAAATAAAVLSYLAGFVAVLLTPFYLTHVRELGPRDMGLTLTVAPLVMTLVAPWAGAVSDRVGYGRLTAWGLAVRAASLLALLLLGPATAFGWVLAALALLGAGSGLFNPPNTSAIMGSVPQERLGIAGGVAAVARNLGMVLGISLGGATFSAFYAKAGGGDLDAHTPALDAAFLAGWRAAMGVGLLACLLALATSLTRSASVGHPAGAGSEGAP
jgi:EmrB/QacA subfamily drug resistance transporter